MTNLGHFGEPFFMGDARKLDDPFADFARYRAQCPVYHNPTLDQWFVFRYEDVAALFRDKRLSADRMKGFVDQAPAEVRAELRAIEPLFSAWVLMMDGAAHARMRRLLNLDFNASAVAALAPAVQRAAEALLDDVRPDGRLDIAADYAFLLPAYVLSDFLGVAPEDRRKIADWSVDFVDFFNIFPITVDTARRMVRSATAMEAHTRGLIAERRARPREDFLGVLVRAGDETGEPTEEEIVANAMLLLLAGHIAVRNLVGNTVYLMLDQAEERARVAGDAALRTSLVEETLRFEPPVTLIPRIAMAEVAIGGQTIPPGVVVQLSIAAANRDPARFPDPDRFDIGRRPGRVPSFGHGPHGCLGAHLAQLEGEIALAALFRRFPRLAPDPARAVRWYRTGANRGPINLPMIGGR